MTQLTALVTGSSRGIGAAIVQALRARGVRVIGHASRPVDSSTIAADLTDPTAPSAIWDEAMDRAGGRIDLLVNNAGVFKNNPIDLSDTPTRVGIEVAELGQGKLDEALVRLELALRENPNNAELRLAVAQTREKIMGRQVQKMQEQLRQEFYYPTKKNGNTT